MKHIYKLILLVGIVLSFAAKTHAAPQDFYLDNETGYPIYHVYVSPSESDNWGGDVLGESVLHDGYKTTVRWAHNTGYRYYDVKFAYSDGDAWTVHHIDLISLNTLRLTYDGDQVNYTCVWQRD